VNPRTANLLDLRLEAPSGSLQGNRRRSLTSKRWERNSQLTKPLLQCQDTGERGTLQFHADQRRP
jgi:hypothetical protein